MHSLQIRTCKSLISSCDNGQAPSPPTLCISASYFKASSYFPCRCFSPANNSLKAQKILLILFNVFQCFEYVKSITRAKTVVNPLFFPQNNKPIHPYRKQRSETASILYSTDLRDSTMSIFFNRKCSRKLTRSVNARVNSAAQT